MDPIAFFEITRQAVATLMETSVPEFVQYAQRMFGYLSAIVLVWASFDLAFTSGDFEDKLWTFIKLLLFMSFGYAMVFFYVRPIPGIGLSFTHLITDQFTYFSTILDVRSVRQVYEHLDSLFNSVQAPGPWEIVAALLYLVLVVVMIMAKVLSIGVVAFGMIASVVLVIVGPIFVPFFIIGPLDFLFWGWFKALLQYGFQPVVAYTYLMVFDKFLFSALTTLPRGIDAGQYLLYGIYLIVFTGVFIYSFWQIPHLTAGIFSGHSTNGVNPFQPKFAR